MFKVGASVYRALRGYTSRVDQEEIINKTQQVNCFNINEFFKQYNNEKGSNSEGFFSQLQSEYGFDEQQQILINMAAKFGQKLIFEGKTDLAQKIIDILNDGIVDKNEAKQLDRIVEKYNDVDDCSCKCNNQKIPFQYGQFTRACGLIK